MITDHDLRTYQRCAQKPAGIVVKIRMHVLKGGKIATPTIGADARPATSE